MKTTTLPHIERDESNDIPLEIPTLRDQFAMAALTGLIREIEILEQYFNEANVFTREDLTKVMSEIAYSYADAMMEARK